jgi:hypothetical protein
MLARNGWVVENQIVSLGASDRHFGLEIVHARYAEIDVVNLELFHEAALIIAAVSSRASVEGPGGRGGAVIGRQIPRLRSG